MSWTVSVTVLFLSASLGIELFRKESEYYSVQEKQDFGGQNWYKGVG